MNTIAAHRIQIGIDSFVSAAADPASGLARNREAGRRAGYPAAQLSVGLHCPGFIGDTAEQAPADDDYPGYAEMFGSIAPPS